MPILVTTHPADRLVGLETNFFVLQPGFTSVSQGLGIGLGTPLAN
jgi:hypothetical protein